MKPRFKEIFFLTILFSFLIPFLVFAVKIENPLKAESFEELIGNLIDFIFWVAVVIVPLIIIVAGFYFLTAAGNPERVSTAKRIIFWSAVGFTIVLLAKGIISVIKQIISG